VGERRSVSGRLTVRNRDELKSHGRQGSVARQELETCAETVRNDDCNDRVDTTAHLAGCPGRDLCRSAGT
jgi:hypothetical protein